MSNMELWYTENQTNNVNFSMKVKSHLYSKQSDFQKIDIIDTYEFGTEKGILINQCESPYYPLNSKEMKRSFNKLNSYSLYVKHINIICQHTLQDIGCFVLLQKHFIQLKI